MSLRAAIAGNVGLIYSVTAPLVLSGANIGIQDSPTFTGLLSATYFGLTQIATPSNPAAGHNRLYFKSDNSLYTLTSAGVETALGSGGGGGGTWGSITGTLSSQTDLQTALNLKAPLASPTFTGTIGTPLSHSVVVVTDSSGNFGSGSVSTTTLAYLDATSSVQTQLNAKQATLTLPLAIGSGGSGQATALAAFNALSPMTTLGDVIYGGASGSALRLAGNTTSTKKFLTQTGTGSGSAAPAYATIAAADLPVPGASALGGVFSKAAVTSNFLTSISSSDGSVGQAQPAFSDISGSVAASQLPNPSSTTLGGVRSAAVVTSQWINSISTSGIPALSQPGFSDISGSVAASQLPNPSSSTLGGIRSAVAVSNQWINSISTSGIPSLTQPAFTDISGSVAASQLPNPSSSTLGGVRSIAAVSHQWINTISTSGIPSLTQPAVSDITGAAASGANADITSATGFTGGISSPTFIDHIQTTTPSTPASLHNRIYFKSDNNVYMLNSSGTEVKVNGAVTNSSIKRSGCSGLGSTTNNKIPIFPTAIYSSGSCITYSTSSTNGDSFTIGSGCAGAYSVVVAFGYTTTTSARFGSSVNQIDLTQFIGSVSEAERLCIMSAAVNGNNYPCPAIRYFADGDVIRASVSSALTCINSIDTYIEIAKLN